MREGGALVLRLGAGALEETGTYVAASRGALKSLVSNLQLDSLVPACRSAADWGAVRCDEAACSVRECGGESTSFASTSGPSASWTTSRSRSKQQQHYSILQPLSGTLNGRNRGLVRCYASQPASHNAAVTGHEEAWGPGRPDRNNQNGLLGRKFPGNNVSRQRRVNFDIRANQVQLLSHINGGPATAEVLSRAEAIQRAFKQGKDLVEVDGRSSPPICELQEAPKQPQGPPSPTSRWSLSDILKESKQPGSERWTPPPLFSKRSPHTGSTPPPETNPSQDLWKSFLDGLDKQELGSRNVKPATSLAMLREQPRLRRTTAAERGPTFGQPQSAQSGVRRPGEFEHPSPARGQPEKVRQSQVFNRPTSSRLQPGQESKAKPSNSTGDRKRLNEQIVAKTVRLVTSEDGKEHTLVSRTEALQLARGKGVDLVEVDGKADPPVCRLLDYAKFRFELRKREKAKKGKILEKRRESTTKELRISSRTEEKDLEMKAKLALGLLTKGYRLKCWVQFKGRDQRSGVGVDLLERMLPMLGEHCRVEIPPKTEGARMVMYLRSPAPSKKKSKNTNSPTASITASEELLGDVAVGSDSEDMELLDDDEDEMSEESDEEEQRLVAGM